jgi:hypothetical protein
VWHATTSTPNVSPALTLPLIAQLVFPASSKPKRTRARQIALLTNSLISLTSHARTVVKYAPHAKPPRLTAHLVLVENFSTNTPVGSPARQIRMSSQVVATLATIIVPPATAQA